jgi:Protein of unknown function (DUF4019)
MAGCIKSHSERTAEAGVQRFHDAWNTQQYVQIYQQADEEFKNQGPQADFVTFLKTLRLRFGQIKQSHLLSFEVQYYRSRAFVTLHYQTEFEHQSSTENFRFAVSDEESRLLGYNVSP